MKVILLGVIAMLCGCASLPTYQTAPVPAGELRVLVYNFGGPVRSAGSVRARTDMVARLMAEKGIGLALIQEGVAADPGFLGNWVIAIHGTKDSIADLAGQVGQHSTSSITWEEFGLQWRTGITSRQPITGVQGLHLTHDKGATIGTTGGLRVASCHLSSKDPEGHFRAVLEAFGDGPGVIGGDFNAALPGLSQQATEAGFQEVPLPPGATSCDRLFYRGLEFIGAEVVLPNTTGISDHNGLLVTLRRLP